MPIDWPFVHKLSANWLPIDCLFNANWDLIKEFISVSANRSLPSIEGSVRLAGSEMNQSNANWLTIRFQTDCQLTTNHCPFKANWELIKEFISVSANRSLPSIEGSVRLAGSEMNQSSANWYPIGPPDESIHLRSDIIHSTDNPKPMQCQSNSFDSWDPVSIVQLHLLWG